MRPTDTAAALDAAPVPSPVATVVETALATAVDFRPPLTPLVPSGAKARAEANIAVIELLGRLRNAERAATTGEQELLATWSGWGAVPEVFDSRNEAFAGQRERLQELLGRDDYAQARASTLNAHYTDPAIASAIWDALVQAGFSGGRVLEPGCGSGTFIGLAPPDAVMVGVEYDPVTAAVAAALYPSAQIRLEGFEATRVPEGSFAAAVGNVPFGKFTVYDPAHNPDRFSIHNHFIIKSLALTAPGGYVAVLTSRYTMDATSSEAREAMAERADLVGAVRLPSKAFARVAGTDVVTDIVILRRRDLAEGPATERRWLDTEFAQVWNADSGDSESMPINAYFADHPDHVLGDMELGHGQFGASSLTVHDDPSTPLSQRLASVLQDIVDGAVQRGWGLSATAQSLTTVSQDTFDTGLITAADRAVEPDRYTLRYNENTHCVEVYLGVDGGGWQKYSTPKSLLAETRELIALRDVATSLMASESDGRPASERDQLRGHLNFLYDQYVSKHGPINRFTWVVPKEPTQERHDAKVADLERRWREQEGRPGQPYAGTIPDSVAAQFDELGWATAAPYKKRRHLDGGIRNDPGWATLASLEEFTEETGAARKAPIFSTDQLTRSRAKHSADTPEEALAICLDRCQRVDMGMIAELLGVGLDDAQALMVGLVYPSLHDPQELEPAVTALSGNVREKLTAAIEAAREDPIYGDYVGALRKVMPPDRTAEEIRIRPGAPWIAPADVAAFACETFGAEEVRADHLAGRWVVEVDNWRRHGRLMTETWGMEDRGADAVSLLEALCNSRSVLINKEDGALDTQATFAAQAKSERIVEEFGRWLFADPDRRERLVGEYNRRFNSLRAPHYDGSHLLLPGLSDHFKPHFYQRNAVARILSEPTTLLDHVVGAGKTGSMIMSAMELRRLGLVRQPWIVVPNHIIEQVCREAKQWYPAAKVLSGSAATDIDGRRRLVAQSAASEWDMVIVPQSAFTAISVSDTVRAQYIRDQMRSMHRQLDQATSERSVKAIERAIKAARNRLEQLTAQARKDDGLRFEQTGCDYLYIDEAHLFKNKQRVCNIEELSCSSASQRAEDLALKLTVLRQRRRDEAAAKGIPEHRVVERVATFATGTPIANSLGELWVMQTYLRPDLLEAAGVDELGDWGATFTATHTTIEVNSTGTKLRPVTRVGKYTNLPDLLALTAAYTDVVVRDQVPVPLPSLKGGQRQIISIEPDIEVIDFITDLGWRADNLDPRDPTLDNILKISNDGRNVSLDPRLAHLRAPTNSRAAAVADQIMRIHTGAADRVYHDRDTGEPLALTGPLQIVFCDRGTPSKDTQQFTIYQAIKDELVTRGMPAQMIRFVHEARKPAELKALFSQCNRGEVSVLIASTEKAGTGTNVQGRAIALHHVDVPWRPADLEQREGRIIRQGNENEVVEILNYVTENTYDTVMWQKVQAKALFIEQMRRNEVLDTEVEDLSGGDIGAAAAETKAIATGDPRYLRQVELDEQVKKLTALERAHLAEARSRDFRVEGLQRTIPQRDRAIESLTPVAQAAAARAEREQPHRICVGGRSFAESADTAQAVAQACQRAYAGGRDKGASKFEPIGITINDIEVLAARSVVDNTLMLRLAVPSKVNDVDGADLISDLFGEQNKKAYGLVRRIENLYTGLPRYLREIQADREREQDELDDLLDNPPAPFEQANTLVDRQAELAALSLELQMAADSPEARARTAAAQQRMERLGRKPGWTLLLNPTPAVLAKTGYSSSDALRRVIKAKERQAQTRYDLGNDGLER
ncbi:helicase-related protein [Mycobacteroides chelonae]|uniref:helicase-related protein n=1 Tax=Mycobacteroides chelonae TaxID=1774 RepID=UPI001E409CE8|nr:helicase-related protein [Mycobacteroides chelonae]